jgi:ribosome biogenesis GTPase
MFLLDNGALLIDTPGMREMGLMADEESLDLAFPEIMAYAGSCRYNDCTHTHEIKCAVQAAVNNGDIAEDRYQSYVKLAKELAFNASQADRQSRLEYKRKQKTLYKGYKQILSKKKRL